MYFAQIKNPYDKYPEPCGVEKLTDTSCEPAIIEPIPGSERFSIVAGKYMYLNGYEILITAPNEGLLYLPLIKSRVPVEWDNLTVYKNDEEDYGCVTEGEARMQGSVTGAIGRDLHRQVMALLTQGPGSFSGKFGEALEKVQEKANQIKGGDNSQETLKDLAAAIKSVEDGIEKYNTSLTNQLNDPNFEYYGSSFISETISQLNGIKDKLTTVSECIDTETGVSSSKKSDFSGMHRMVILQNCFVADTLINQAGTQIPALIDNVKNTLEIIPPGTKLLSWEEGVRFQVGTVITQAALNETAANCATSPAKKESKNYEICNLTNGAIKAVYIPKSGQGDKHWAFQLDHPSVSGWVKEYVPGVATTNRYAVCLKTEVLTDGTCEYKEYDLEKGQYVGVLAADHMARMYAFLFEMIATGGTAPTVGVAAIESILMIAGEVCQTINFTEGNDMVLLLNAVNVAYQVRHGRAMSQAERQALEGALNSTDDGISFFKKYKEKGKAFFDELAGKIRRQGSILSGLQAKFAGKQNVLNWINELPPNSPVLNSLDELPSDANILSNFANDLDVLKTFFEGNASGIKAWEKLLHTNISQAIRTNVNYLSAVSKQVENYPNVLFKFERVLLNIPSNQLDNFFNKLDNPKSIDHVRSLAGDFENIPGINVSNYVPNGMANVEIPPPATWADPYLHLPGNAATTFTSVVAKTLSPGQKIYRVLDQTQNPAGGYWTYSLPTNKAQLYGGTAVRPEWNAATHYVEYTIPSSGLKVWDGPAARQAILNDVNQAHLPGGSTQIYIPDMIRQDGSFSNLQLIPLSL
jgi:hypothetical protein